MSDWTYLGGDFGEPISSPDSKEGVVSLAMLFGVVVLRYWHEGEIKLLQIDTRTHVQEIGLVAEDVQDKKSWTAAMAVAGVVVAGPLGALAGLAAPKKRTVVFSMVLKEGNSSRVTSESFGAREGKKFVLATSKDNYSKILANSGLHPHVVTGAVAPLSEGADLVQQLEKLAALKERGLISEEEFSIAKAKLL
jgi:preprotein translocase subunit Sec61beta